MQEKPHSVFCRRRTTCVCACKSGKRCKSCGSGIKLRCFLYRRYKMRSSLRWSRSSAGQKHYRRFLPYNKTARRLPRKGKTARHTVRRTLRGRAIRQNRNSGAQSRQPAAAGTCGKRIQTLLPLTYKSGLCNHRKREAGTSCRKSRIWICGKVWWRPYRNQILHKLGNRHRRRQGSALHPLVDSGET